MKRDSGLEIVLRRFLTLLAVVMAVLPVCAAEWSRFRGAEGNGCGSQEIRRLWSSKGLPVAWAFEANGGYGGVALYDGKAYFLVAEEDSKSFTVAQRCVAVDARGGHLMWSSLINTNSYGSTDPHSTPTVQDGRVYAYGPNLVLACLEAGTGGLVWKRDLQKEFGGRRGSYENSQSPWVEEGRVFVSVAASTNCLLAFNSTNGALIWRGHTNGLTYASPIGATIHGVRQIVFADASGLVSVLPTTGELLWRHVQGRSMGRQGASPVFHDNFGICVLDSSRGGAVGFRINFDGQKFSTVSLWTNEVFDATYVTPIIRGTNVYLNSSWEGLCCLQAATGRLLWSRQSCYFTSMIFLDGCLLGFDSGGEHCLLSVSSSGCQELARGQEQTRNFLNSPAIGYGRIYQRDENGVVCYDATMPVPLKLEATVARDPDRLVLTAFRVDGTAIPLERLGYLRLLRKLNLKPTGQFAPVSTTFSLSNGVARCEVPLSLPYLPREGYYLIAE